MNNRIWKLCEELSKNSAVSELMVNKGESVYIEKDGDIIRLDSKFTDNEIEEFCLDAAKYNRKPFDIKNPVLDGTLPDGSRVNLIHQSYTSTTHVITVRKHSQTIKKFESSPGIFGLTPDWVDFLKFAIKARINFVVSGGTGVGKTTLLNLLMQEVSPRERIITVEDTRELKFNLPDVVRLEARPDGLGIRELLKNTLRMRPDRIIVGEVRGAEVFDLLQAMNTGHEGSMTSVHSNSPGECLMRLENLYYLSGYDVPLKALRYQISSAIDFIIQVRREKDGKRVISQITEISGMEGDRILQQDLAIQKSGRLTFTGLVPACMPKLQDAGMEPDYFLGM
jgi:pilus assembly protein CpaF